MAHGGQSGVVFDSGGYQLLGTFFEPRGEGPKPTVILLHGIPGIEKNVDLALGIRDAGWNVLLFHYRGCWGSGGNYSVHTVPDDVIAAADFLSELDTVDPNRIVLVGHSLGGWAAILAGARDERFTAICAIGALGDNSLFPLDDAEYAAGYVPWLTNISAAELAEQWGSLPKTHSPMEQVAKIAPRPFSIIHSEHDEPVPYSHAEAISKAAGFEHKLISHPEADHSFTWHRSWLIEQVTQWLKEL